MTQFETTSLLLYCGALNDLAEKLMEAEASFILPEKPTSDQVKEIQLGIEQLVINYLPFEVKAKLKHDETYSKMLYKI